VDERVFPTIADWRVSAPKDEMPTEDTYSPEAVAVLNTHRTPIQEQPEALLWLVGLSQRYFLGDDLYPTFLHDDDRDGYGFVQFDSCSEPHQEMEDPAVATESSRTTSTIERSPLDFANENPSQQSTGGDETEDQGQETVAPEVPSLENITTTGVALETGLVGKIVPWVPSTVGGKSLALMRLERDPLFHVPTLQETPTDVSDPDPLSFANPQSIPKQDVVQSSKGVAVVGDPESENTSFTSMAGSLESIYQPEWGITNSYRLDTSKACQDLVDHLALPSYG
nr:hypothetical protein [Tanacetum cinerariifolium]